MSSQSLRPMLLALVGTLALAFAAAAQGPPASAPAQVPPQTQAPQAQAPPPAQVPLAPGPNFNAISVSRDEYGRTMRSRVYVGGGKVRVDPQQAEPYGQSQGYLLLDVARQTATVVNPAQGYFMRETPQVAWQTLQSFTPGASPCPPGTPPPGASCRDTGPETVSGRETERWEINQSIQGRPTRTRIWVDRKLGVPVKWENSTSGHTDFTAELQDIIEGPQTPSLFVIPPGLRDATPPASTSQYGAPPYGAPR